MLTLRSTRACIGAEIGPADIVLGHDFIESVRPHGTMETCIDFGNLLIAPGFIDLHSDSIEKEIEPRPGAEFPVKNALVELDKKLAMAGITTMFHAIAFNDESLVGQRGTKIAADLIRALSETNSSLLSIDNLVHARYEITSLSSFEIIKNLIDEKQVQLLSLMDHSPGQGQFRSLEKWKQYHVPVYKLSETEVHDIVKGQLEKKSRCMSFLEELTVHARKNDILLASHDDDTPEKVDLMESLGISIAEFPLNLETAAHARSSQMTTGMGAPNVVRGKSQSGNISARELLANNSCDFLCSDYHPTSMLQAVYAIHHEMGQDLAQAFGYVTSAPARTAGLTDRGEIAPNKLGDLVIIDDETIPTVLITMKSGIPVYNGNNCICMSAAG